MITRDSMVRQGSRAVFRELNEGGVVLHLDTAAYYRVNATGRLLWSVLNGGTVRQVVDEFRGRFREPPPTLESDVMDFLASLHERDLIEVA